MTCMYIYIYTQQKAHIQYAHTDIHSHKKTQIYSHKKTQIYTHTKRHRSTLTQKDTDIHIIQIILFWYDTFPSPPQLFVIYLVQSVKTLMLNYVTKYHDIFSYWPQYRANIHKHALCKCFGWKIGKGILLVIDFQKCMYRDMQHINVWNGEVKIKWTFPFSLLLLQV